MQTGPGAGFWHTDSLSDFMKTSIEDTLKGFVKK